jgi:hypothetical protein
LPLNDLPADWEGLSECRLCAIRIAKKAYQSHSSGIYASDCLHCAVALGLSARPSRLHQEAMFAAIARARNVPTRNAIIAELEKIKANEQNDLFS